MSDLMLNHDVVHLKESSTLLINYTVKKLRHQGEKIVHFGFGQSPFPVHPKIVETLREHASEKSYLSTQGLIDLRKNISSFYKSEFGYDFKPENIIMGPGSKELLFQTLFVLEGTVIIPAPSWVSYGPQVSIRGKFISCVHTKEENSYKLMGEELEQLCQSLTAQQKILIINSPNNPTGAVYTDDEIQAIVKVCRKHNIIVFSDEIYGQIDYTGTKKKGFFHYYPERTVVTAGLSKSHSAGGYRLGFIATSEEMAPVIRCLSSMVSETFSAVSAPIQYAAITAYSGDPEIQEYVQDCSKIHEAAGMYLYRRFKAMNLNVPQPEGAFYLMPDFENHRSKLLEKYEVSTQRQIFVGI